jgi:heavy metal translocating P-type ATPase
MTEPPKTCDLCGLPLRRGAVEADIGGQRLRFCCLGCRQVYALLLESADSPDPERFRETEIYKRCLEAGIIPATEADLEPGDEEGPQAGPGEGAIYTSAGEEPQACGERVLTLDLQVQGMWCPACAWVVEQGVRKDRGVERAECRFVLDRLHVAYDPVLTSPERIRERVRKLGYRIGPTGEDSGAQQRAGEFIRFGVSGFLTLNVMMLSFALYSGFFAELGASAAAKISWPIVILSGVVFVYGGAPIHRSAAAGMLSGNPGMETLIGLGAGSAFFYSLFNWMQGSIHLYFDTACMLITLVLVGKLAERKARDGILSRLDSFYSLVPAKVRICTEREPQGRYADASVLEPGDVFRAEPGETVAADGVVREGRALLDESSLTGEPRPVGKEAGDPVRSGTRVVEGTISVRAESVGASSTVGRLISVMEAALAGKTGFESRMDRMLRWFVPSIALLAGSTAAVCFLAGLGAGESLVRGITVLVISCPCALGVAVPLARVAGISLAGTRGILVHDFDAFERMRSATAAVFDKTGTLTRGDWRLVEVLPAEGWTEERILSVAAGLEAFSDRYVARAVVRAATERGLAIAQPQGVEERENGIQGRLDGRPVAMGSARFVALTLAPEESPANDTERPRGEHALSTVYMAVEGRLCARLRFGDSLRESACATVAELKRLGMRLALVSGDGSETTRLVGDELGIEQCSGGMLPADKARFVEGLKAEGHRVIMVGDGVNDAPALAAADIGIGAGSGSRIGREAPDVTLLGEEPRQILELGEFAGRVRRTVRQNLAFTFAYNAVAIPVAMSGLLNPLIAVGAMMLSSLSVTGNSLRLVARAGSARKKPRTATPEEPGAVGSPAAVQ